MIIKSDEFRSQYQNEQACHIKFEQIFKEAENACKPESLPSKDQQEKVSDHTQKFKKEKREMKNKISDKKTSRRLKGNWKSID